MENQEDDKEKLKIECLTRSSLKTKMNGLSDSISSFYKIRRISQGAFNILPLFKGAINPSHIHPSHVVANHIPPTS
jgi:hypothetical protein